jgi:hypothetical protein
MEVDMLHIKKNGLARKILMCGLSLTMAFSGVSMMPASAEAAKNSSYDYGDALAKSLLFYQLQESGKLSEETKSRCNWRDDACVTDGQPYGIDLSGGWNDAGDNVKFNLPAAYTGMMLAWSYLNNPKAYETSGQEKWMLHDLKWVNDYFVKCNPDSKTYWYQCGDGGLDHNYWAAVETIETRMPDRECYKVDDTSAGGGSAVEAETSASLAAASMAFEKSDPKLAATYLEHARTLFDMAWKAKSDKGYTAANGFYNSWSGFWDELALSACWLYNATGEEEYLDKAKEAETHFG